MPKQSPAEYLDETVRYLTKHTLWGSINSLASSAELCDYRHPGIAEGPQIMQVQACRDTLMEIGTRGVKEVDTEKLRALLSMPKALGTGSRASAVVKFFNEEIAPQLRDLLKERTGLQLQSRTMKFWRDNAKAIENVWEKYPETLRFVGFNPFFVMESFAENRNLALITDRSALGTTALQEFHTMLKDAAKALDNKFITYPTTELGADCSRLSGVAREYAEEILPVAKAYAEYASGASMAKG